MISQKEKHHSSVFWKGFQISTNYFSLPRHFKLFLDIVPSSSADSTRALRGCFRGGSVYISFRFVLKQSKASNSVIFWLQAKELGLSVCCNTFRNFNGSLHERRMYPAQTITIEWTVEKRLDKWQTTNKPPKHKLSNPTNRWSKVQADAHCPNSKKQLKQQR